MDKIITIKLEKVDVSDFCHQCESFDGDIDLIDGSHVLDAKDCEHIILLSFDRNFCVSINSNDDQEIMRFNEIIEQYKAKLGEKII